MSGKAGGVRERRQSDRFSLDASLVVRPKDNQSRVIRGRVIDLSRGGIRAVIAAELQIEDVLEVEFGLPYTSGVLRLGAVVRTRQSYQYGLEFARIVAADRAKINRTCAALNLLQ